MREPPQLADAAVIAALRAHYGLTTAALTFLPIGNDSASFVYRVGAADGAFYLLKLRSRKGFSAPSLVVPRYLRERGVAHILAPLPTLTHGLWVRVNDFAMSLYPFIDGRTGADGGLADSQWTELGATVKQIHADCLTPDLMQILPRETFVPSRRSIIAEMETALVSGRLGNAEERELAAFWNSRRDEIRAVVERADELGSQLRKTSAPLVLCHADLHTYNVLVDIDQQFWLVDWDETMLALKERDLMFVIGGIGAGLVGPHESACFLQGYGDAAIDATALVYYRYGWAVQDIAAYSEEVFFSPNLSAEARRAALRGLMRLFEPGQIVAIALASDSAAA